MVWFSDEATYILISNCLQISIGSCSILCGVLNLLLIYYMKIWNHFIILIFNLAISQLIYDLSVFLLFCGPSNPICYIDVDYFITIGMGIVVTLWTNVIISILYITVLNIRPNLLKDYFYTIFWAVNLSGLIFVTIYVTLINTILPIYNGLFIFYDCFRLVSIIYNFVIVGLIYYKIRNYNKNNPIFELTNRLIYYPIVQIITRIPPTWYELQFEVVNYNDDITTTKIVSLMFYSIFLYSAGIGFFFVFLTVQPNAYKFFKNSIKSFFGYNNNINNDDDNSNSEDVSVRESSVFNRMSDLDLNELIIENNNRSFVINNGITITTISELHNDDNNNNNDYTKMTDPT